MKRKIFVYIIYILVKILATFRLDLIVIFSCTQISKLDKLNKLSEHKIKIKDHKKITSKIRYKQIYDL